MALRNSNSHKPTTVSESSISNAEQRSRIYAKMAKDLDENGAVFLKQGETSQSLSLSDLFTLENGTVTPVLKAASPPVRANVLHLSPEYSVPISEAVKSIFSPYFNKAIWFQNSSMYHFSMFHASHHIAPVPATEEEIEVEASAVKVVAEDVCPLHIILDRVVLTSTGVLVGCWQMVSGTDPVTIRDKLRTALPRAPEKQLYDKAMLHTSFARLLGHPNKLSEATVSELWYVEEYDVLALALNGRMKTRKISHSPILLKSSFKTFIVQIGIELQMNSGIAPAAKSGMAVEKTPSRVHSTEKKQEQIPRRSHKAEREKMKREHLNDLFLALANSLELSDQNNGKAFLLNEASRVVSETIAQIKSLRRENAALLSESQYITTEKKELQDENSALEAQIGNFQCELKARASESQLDLNVAPPECNLQELASHASQDHTGFHFVQPGQQQVQTVNQLYLVPICSNMQVYEEQPTTAQLASKPSKPHARYPAPADTWPSQLLEKQQELGKEIQQSDRNDSKQ
ncbi:unnamed protein product [Fraxinus pennsylvanica]|uniref:BHLH domain-containing protein n=1 Tax=Fraxinus pennsylvanica TaxID=56036 RepID=A0AAD2EFA1_9LAMI|nr:unnamed protein product [Fraxinus pennsylvanica]